MTLTDGKQEMKRTYGLKDGQSINYMSLRAVQFISEAITDNDTILMLHTSNRYIVSMLERDDDGPGGQWVKNAKTNAALISSIRDNLSEFSHVAVLFDKDSDVMLETKEAARAL